MRQTPSTTQSIVQAQGHEAARTDDQQALMRGLLHGVLLSMAVWIAAAYLTLALR